MIRTTAEQIVNRLMALLSVSLKLKEQRHALCQVDLPFTFLN